MWAAGTKQNGSVEDDEHTQINADGTIVNFVRHYCDCDVLLVKDGKDEREQEEREWIDREGKGDSRRKDAPRRGPGII